jgi:uridine phosphorylase
MLFNNNEMFHIGLCPSDGAKYAIICGDPGRVESIAKLMDKPEPITSKREYTSFAAEVDGNRVLIISHGIGGPSTAICVEELHMIGVDTIIRVGTCGGMAMNVCKEDIVISSAAIRAEGTSREYLPIEFPAAADFSVTLALREAAKKSGRPYHIGVVHCKDSFYGQHSPERMPVATELDNKWKAWLGGGALASEMETAALFCVSAVLGMRAGAVLRVIWNQERVKAGLTEETATDELSAAKIAVEAIRLLINQNS